MNCDSELEQALREIDLPNIPGLDERILKDAFTVLDELNVEGSTIEPETGRRRFLSTVFWNRGRSRTLFWTATCLLSLVGVVWLMTSSDSWARVVQTVRTKPWIHGTAEGPDGLRSEFWYSSTRDVSAMRQGDRSIFDDHRLHIRYTYEPEDKQLYRVPHDSGFHKSGFRSLQNVFAGLFRGDKAIGSSFPNMDVVEHHRRRVREQGRTWIEYDLLLRRGANSKSSNLGRLVFRVDPQSHLPHSMQMTDLSGDKPQSIRFQIDYPKQGPVDIYALGVPHLAKLIDRVPNDDLNRLLEGVNASLERFDDYQAYVLDGEIIESRKRPCTVASLPHLWRIYRKGMRWRLESGQFRLDEKFSDLPLPGVEMRKWILDYASRLDFVPISLCDGKAIYRAHLTHPNGRKRELQKLDHWELTRKIRPENGIGEGTMDQVRWFRPELVAYPSVPIGQFFKTEVEASPSERPPGTVLVTSCSTMKRGRRTGYTARHWIDPSRSFIAMKWDWFDDTTKSIKPYIMEKIDKSPSGIWYPTVMRWKTGSLLSDGSTSMRDQVKQYFLDFEAELPDSLFKRE